MVKLSIEGQNTDPDILLTWCVYLVIELKLLIKVHWQFCNVRKQIELCLNR